MARFRKEIIKIGPYADPVLGRGEITPAQLASIRRSWRPGIKVRMADSNNKPGQQVGTVESLERVGDAVVAILDVDPETSRGIQQRTILGVAAVIDPLACNSLHSVLITNRPPMSSPGYELAAGYDQDGQLLALTAATEEAPFVSIMEPYPAASARYSGTAELAAPTWDPVVVDGMVYDIIAQHQDLFTSRRGRRSFTWQGRDRQPVQLSADVTDADVDGAIAELAAARGTWPYVIEQQLADLATANEGAPVSGRAELTAADKIPLIRELVMLSAAPEDEVMLSAGPAAGADLLGAIESETSGLSAEAFALARGPQRPGPLTSTAPNAMGGSPPHEPFFGPHDHEHDHPSHSHPHSRPDHGHRHVTADGQPIGTEMVTGQPTGFAAGYPGARVAGVNYQHHHVMHSHVHHHGHDTGLPDNNHSHFHLELEQPGGDVYRLPGEIDGRETSPAAAVASIMARNPHEGFSGGQVRGRSYIYEEPRNVPDTDARQPRHGGQIHPAAAEVLARNRGTVSAIPGPLAELRIHGRLFDPLGREGEAVARTRQARTGAERPATR